MRFLRHAALFACIPVAAIAQSPAAGQWTVRYTLAYRNLHTGDTTLVDETGVLSLHARGDSLTGFWQRAAARDEPAAAVRAVRGTARGDTVRVQLDPPPHSLALVSDLAQDLVEWLKT